MGAPKILTRTNKDRLLAIAPLPSCGTRRTEWGTLALGICKLIVWILVAGGDDKP